MANDQSDDQVPNPPGFPFINYAQRERNLSGVRPLHIPRPKYTFLVEYEINPAWIMSNEQHVTNLLEFIPNGKLFTMLKSIDHPKPTVDVETLRSYNKYIKIPKKVEHTSLSMTFHDDSTSIAMALWKENLNFYSHIGDLGSGLVGRNTNLFGQDGSNSIQINETLVTAQGSDVRSGMDIRPSLGLRLKPNSKRVFLDRMIVYDLGTEPDSVNVYYYHKPIITNWDHQNLDKEDRSGRIEINATFEVENYYFVIGQNRQKLADIIQLYLGFVPPENEKIQQTDAEVHNAHGLTFRPDFSGADPTDISPRTTNIPTPELVSTDPVVTAPAASEPAIPPSTDRLQELERERSTIENEKQKIFERSASGFSDADRNKVAALEVEAARVTNEINTERAALDSFNRSQTQNSRQVSTVTGTASSLTNAQKKFGI